MERTTELTLKTRQLEEALEVSRAGERAKSRFVANMSHELRTPMNGILGMADDLADTNLDARQSDQLSTLIEASNHLNGLLGSLLDFSQLETGTISIDPIDFEPAYCSSRQ